MDFNTTLKHKAINLLARREYGYLELKQKLIQSKQDDNQIDNLMSWLVETGLQSDQRFCEMYLRHRAFTGYGPIRIRMELQQKGIPIELIESVMTQESIDWQAELKKLISKKAAKAEKWDTQSKQKCILFLQRRGYSLDQIYSEIMDITTID